MRRGRREDGYDQDMHSSMKLSKNINKLNIVKNFKHFDTLTQNHRMLSTSKS